MCCVTCRPAARGAHGSRAGGYDPAMGQTRKGKSLTILAALNMVRVSATCPRKSSRAAWSGGTRSNRGQRLDAVGDELHGERRQDDAEQPRQDGAAGLTQNLVYALGKQEDQKGQAPGTSQ